MFESGPQHHQSQPLCYKLLKRRKHSSHVWRFCASAVFSPGITAQIRNAPWPARRASGICWQPRYKGRRMLSPIFGKMAGKYGSIVPFCFSTWYNAGNAGNEPPTSIAARRSIMRFFKDMKFWKKVTLICGIPLLLISMLILSLIHI